MGFFDFLKKASAEADQKREQEETERKERKRKDALSQKYFDDVHTKQLEKEYYNLLQKIEDKYKELNKKGDFSGRQGTNLISNCQKASALFLELVPLWEQYEESIPLCPIFARHAMIHEKRGEYDKAAAVCVVAIRAGITDDGTKGGMPARLRRMLKKGNLKPTEEVLALLNR